MTTQMRLMLVDDHYLVRLGLSSVIALEADMTVCAEAATGLHAIELYRSEKPDVTLMDLRLPDLQWYRCHSSDSRRVSGRQDHRALHVCGRRGDSRRARGWRARLPCENREAGRARGYDTESGRGAAARAARRGGTTRVPLATLALVTRELEVLKLMVVGKRNREIAAHLDISEGTVKVHVSNILNKLGAADRTEAVTQALQRGIVALAS